MNSTIRNLKTKEIVENFQPSILEVRCDKETITVNLSDGRVISIPTGWYKILREAEEEQLKNVKIMPAKRGIYWPDLEEFLSIKVFTNGLNAGC